MNSLIQKFYTLNGEQAFKEILFLNGASVSWEEISKRAPDLPRGWYELSRISPEDRIEFTRDFWLDRFPYHPSAHPLFFEFFEQLDDIFVVLTGVKEGSALSAELVYSLKDNSTFFRGKPPCSDVDWDDLVQELGTALPRDYKAFMHIHNGFGKLSEMGLLSLGEISVARRRVLELLIQAKHRVTCGGQIVDPGSLIPFFELLGLGCFQCFYTDWYPGNEMGNVYLSGIDYTISDTSDKKMWQENLAFPTFMEWFTLYLEGMSLSL